MKNQCKLPVKFLKEININKSKDILKKTLKDYSKLEETYINLSKVYTLDYLNRIYPGILNICLYKGINNMKNILVEDIDEAEKQGVIIKDLYKNIITKFLYFMGYIDKPLNNSNFNENIINIKAKISDVWIVNMQNTIERFINNLLNSNMIASTSVREKISSLNKFALWFIENRNIQKIENLFLFDRNIWLEYIEYIKGQKDISDKTKGRYISNIKQFIEWVEIKENTILSNKKIIFKTDTKNLNKNTITNSLSFRKREYGEKILKYLINEYIPETIYDKYIKEAIIIAANSAMRISEIRNLKYKSCFYSEDEGLYKIILEYSDKLKQKNRTIYITEDGYKAICRVEKLREQTGILKEKYNTRTGKKYIHLFEYRGQCSIKPTVTLNFFKKIKRDIGLVDTGNKVVPGGFHAFRHMFAMTLFKESDYNISVVRYLLGHRNYNMSYRYLEEEKEKIIKDIRSSEISQEFSGKGIETLLNIILTNKKSQNKNILNIMDSEYNLSSLIEFKTIKKVSFGYCLNPCNNANKCIRCKYFFISKKDKDNLIKSIIELFELICFRKNIISDKKERYNDNNLKENILDLEILISEVTNFGIKKEYIYKLLEKGDMNVASY